MDHSNVGVVIITFEDWEHTLACLKKVHAQTDTPRRIVVCDNGSGNRTVDRVFEGWCAIAREQGMAEPVEVFGMDNSFAPLTLLRRDENEGAAGGGINAALNLLLYDRDCTLFWILHNDTLPEPYAMAALLHHAAEEDTIGIVGSTLLYQDNDLLECAAGGSWRWTGHRAMLDQGVDRHALSDRKDIARQLDFVSAASCLITRTLVDTIGLFDERFFNFYEDVEYSLRAKRAGFKLNWAPGALVRHASPHSGSLTPLLGVTEAPDLAPDADYLYVRNRFFLIRREKPWALPFALITLPLPLSRRLFRGQQDRFSTVIRAAKDGAAGRMGKPART